MFKLLSRAVFTLSLMLMTSLSFADPIWIDVRTVEENTANSIEGDLNIPMASISPESLADIYGKDAEINLYCRTGNRSGQVTELLTAAGFTNVHNLGGIEDVKKLREAAAKNSSH